MGFLRIALAIMVLLSHTDLHYDFLSGHAAVAVFFVISGYYMQLVLSTRYNKHNLGARYWVNFYLSRYLRLYPVYCVSVVLMILMGEASHVHWASLQGIAAAFSNLTMFGLNMPSVQNIIVGPAWSIGVEVSFYILAPYILTRSSKILVALLVLGIAEHFLPYNTHLPFLTAIDMFMFGALAQRHGKAISIKAPAYILQFSSYVFIFVALFFVFVKFDPLMVKGSDNHLDTIIYPIVFAFLIPTLFAMSKKFPADRWIGDLSYPFYLFHMPVLLLLEKSLQGWELALSAILLTGTSSALVLLLEKRFLEPLRMRIAERTW